MGANGNGQRLSTWMASIAAVGSVLVLVWNGHQESRAKEIVEQRNAQQAQICESVNALNSAVQVLLRDATSPGRGSGSPEQDQAREAYRQSGLDILEDARCVVDPIRN